jgi:toxin ParE1/3/4
MILVLTDEAKEDLADYWDFVYANAHQYGQDPEQAADNAIDRFFERARNLELFPESGRLREEFGAGIRCLPIRGYLLFYQIRPEEVLIVRVLHGSRDLETAWSQP